MLYRYASNPVPQLGDFRWKRRFAWIPVAISPTTKVWLQYVYVRQTYVGPGLFFPWVDFGGTYASLTRAVGVNEALV
jgi:hypothetical protein